MSSHEQMKFSVGRQVCSLRYVLLREHRLLLPAQRTEASNREQNVISESDEVKAKMTWKSPLFSEIPFLPQAHLTMSGNFQAIFSHN